MAGVHISGVTLGSFSLHHHHIQNSSEVHLVSSGFYGDIWPECEVDESPLFEANVWNAWNITSITPCDLMAWSWAQGILLIWWLNKLVFARWFVCFSVKVAQC